ATAAVLRAPTAGRGHIEIKGRRAVRFREKEGPSEGWVYAGLALFERTVLSDFAPGPASLERLVLPRLAERGQLNVWPFTGQLFDIGTPQGLEAFRHVSQDETARANCPQKPPGDGQMEECLG
ncbi:MAG TPA: hypothetical protein VFA18_06240, partial [Gemmataceae bacterium]|nr:hypothetical protein [Gemmataceae bacterium]